jgi:DNA-directed RNA polymerase specialized sigma24 family protein
MAYQPPTDIPAEAWRQIKFNANGMIGHYGFAPSDRQDLQQELALAVVIKSRRFNPTRSSPSTFYSHVASRTTIDLCRAASAGKRDWRRRRGGADPESFPAPEPEPALLDLRVDVRIAVAAMPDELRPVAHLLMRYSKKEAARRSGLTPGQMRGRCLRIARHLREAGIAPEYQDSPGCLTIFRARSVCTSQGNACRREVDMGRDSSTRQPRAEVA